LYKKLWSSQPAIDLFGNIYTIMNKMDSHTF
jgi:hypothetical protein